MPAWRSSLPKQSDLIEMSRNDTIIRTSMDVGPQKVRRRSTKAIEAFSVSLHFTSKQLREFVDFWETDLAGGVGSFTWEHPRTDAQITCRIVGGFPAFSMVVPGEAQDRVYSAQLLVEIL
jgi:hypothetical protein